MKQRMKSARLVFLVVALLASGAAVAGEFRSVGAAPAVLYDAPSDKSRKLFVAPRGMPVELVQPYGEWVKVRDASGELSWVHARALVPRRQVVVTAPLARVHVAADDSTPVVFTADRHVLLELMDPPANGWVRVRHTDGQSGFVKAAEVWGD